MKQIGEGVDGLEKPVEPEVYVVTRLHPPVFSGEEGSGDVDLRPVQVIPGAGLPPGAVIVNDPSEGVEFHIRH